MNVGGEDVWEAKRGPGGRLGAGLGVLLGANTQTHGSFGTNLARRLKYRVPRTKQNRWLARAAFISYERLLTCRNPESG